MQSREEFLKKAIIKTFCYSDIFDYPLKLSEIFTFLISNKNFSRSEIKIGIKELTGSFLEQKDNLYFLKGREKIIKERKNRNKFSKLKLKKINLIKIIFSFIPTVRLVGISGSLALLNAEDKDDIDLFIITRKNYLWITRLIISILFLIMGIKRKRLDLFYKDKFCLNMFMSCDNLTFNYSDRNLFIARELANLKVIFDRSNTYQELISNNIWISRFLANFSKLVYEDFWPDRRFNSSQSEKKSLQAKKLISLDRIRKRKLFINFFSKFTAVLERSAFLLQYYFMKNRIKNEKIELKRACFHPFSYSSFVLLLYKQKNNFYLRMLKRIRRNKIKAEVSLREVTKKFNINTPGY